jgi:hypothetical protein
MLANGPLRSIGFTVSRIKAGFERSDIVKVVYSAVALREVNRPRFGEAYLRTARTVR